MIQGLLFWVLAGSERNRPSLRSLRSLHIILEHIRVLEGQILPFALF